MDYEPESSQEFSSVTQCPYCQTAFHVGLAQLDVAAGRVRCGGCLRVFNAKEHFLVEQQRLFDDEPAQEDTSPAEDTQETVEDFPLNVDLFGAEIPEEDEPVILGSFNHHSGTSIPRKAILEHKVDEFRQEDYEHASAEEVLGEHQHLLVRDEDLEPEPDPELKSEYISLSTADDEMDMDYLEINMSEEAEEFDEPDDNALPELLEEAAEREAALEFPDQEQEQEQEQAIVDREAEDQLYENLEESDDRPDSEPHTDEFFILHTVKGARKAGVIWWVALILVILVLPAQLLFTQPESLLIKPWFRQAGAVICPSIGCPSPEYSAPNRIRISGFIEPHPEFQDSLVAKIDLHNQGLAEQAFPTIAVYFRNLSGQVTASRIFQPTEYLLGEARGYRSMPVNRNVQLELELLDPGDQSTSYELYIAN